MSERGSPLSAIISRPWPWLLALSWLLACGKTQHNSELGAEGGVDTAAGGRSQGSSGKPVSAAGAGHAGRDGAGGAPSGSSATGGSPATGGDVDRGGSDHASGCEQPQRDPDHCGDCDTACGPTEPCSAGHCTQAPEELAADPGCGSIQLLMQGGMLYALSTASGTLRSFAVASDSAETLVVSLHFPVSAFALDAANAYEVIGTLIRRVSLQTGLASLVVVEGADILDITLQAGTLYYAVGLPALTTSSTTRQVKSIDAAANNGVGALVSTPFDEGVPAGIAIAGNYVLYASSTTYTVEAEALTGGEHIKLGASQGALLFGPRSVQTDGESVFWANGPNLKQAAVLSENHDQKNAASALGDITAYALGGATVYFGSDNGDLEEARIGAGSSTWRGRGLGTIGSIALDESNVYFSTDACQIMKAPR